MGLHLARETEEERPAGGPDERMAGLDDFLDALLFTPEEDEAFAGHRDDASLRRAAGEGRVLARGHRMVLRQNLSALPKDWSTFNVGAARASILALAPPGGSIEAARALVRSTARRWLRRDPLTSLEADIALCLSGEPNRETVWPFLEAVFVILLSS